VPRVGPESAKVTVPVGAPPEDVTVAVSVTVAPCKAGFGDTVRAVAVVTEEDPPPCEVDPPEQPCNSPTQKQTKAIATPIDNNLIKYPVACNLFCDDKHMPRTILPSNFVWKTNECLFPGGLAEERKGVVSGQPNRFGRAVRGESGSKEIAYYDPLNRTVYVWPTGKAGWLP
jgi:hypothetical protein